MVKIQQNCPALCGSGQVLFATDKTTHGLGMFLPSLKCTDILSHCVLCNSSNIIDLLIGGHSEHRVQYFST